MKKKRIFAIACGLVASVGVPFAVSDVYYINLLIVFGIFAILALSMDIVIGYLGELSLGHAAFFGLGAYTSALLAKNFGFPFWLALPAAGLVSALVGYIIGFLSFRLRGAYFSIITLAFAQILQLISNNWVQLTNGPMGLTKIPAPVISFPGLFRLELSNEFSYYYLILLLLVLTIIVIKKVVNSSTGRAFMAIREQESLAKSVGINTFRFKLLAFSLSTMLAGVAGSAYAHYFRIISPDLLGIYYTSTPLMMVFIGGRASILGPLAGAAVFSLLPEALRMAGNLRMAVFSILLLLSLMFMPEGLFRGFSMAWKKIRTTKKDRAFKTASGN